MSTHRSRTVRQRSRWLPAFALIVLVSAAAGLAQEVADLPPPLALDEAIALALAGSPHLAAAEAYRRAADAELAAARAQRLPRLAAEAVTQRSDHPALVFGQVLAQERFTAADFVVDRLNDPPATSDWSARLAVVQPLWTGGRLGAGIDSATAAGAAAGHDLEAARQGAVHRVVVAHTGAVLAARRLAVARQAVATAESHAVLARDLHAAGLVVESDRLQAEVRVAELREAAIRTASRAEVAIAELNLALGRDPATPLRLPDDLSPAEAREPLDVAALTARARAARPDLAAAHERIAALEASVRLARAARRPEIGWRGAWETHEEDFFGTGGDHWTVAVEARLPLFDRGLGARVGAAEARLLAARHELDARGDAVAVEVRQALSELRAADARGHSARQSVDLARRSLQIVEDRYREGLATLPELRDAETALTAALERELDARGDLVLADAHLDLATGTLAPRAPGSHP